MRGEIKAVQEFFSPEGRCREVQLTTDPHCPVRLSIVQMPSGFETIGPVASDAPSLRIQYRGRKEDLIALGCISRDRLAMTRYGQYQAEPCGAILYVETKSAPWRRAVLELSYFAQSRSFASMLPGVHAYCADWLEALTARPRLRLVVDNTRRESCGTTAG